MRGASERTTAVRGERVAAVQVAASGAGEAGGFERPGLALRVLGASGAAVVRVVGLGGVDGVRIVELGVRGRRVSAGSGRGGCGRRNHGGGEQELHVAGLSWGVLVCAERVDARKTTKKEVF